MMGRCVVYFLAGVFTVAQAATAAVFVVDSTSDEGDTNPGDGQARTSAGTVTLRAALEESNALGGDDVIQFSNTAAIFPEQPLPAIDSPDVLRIEGAGGTVLDGARLPRGSALLVVESASNVLRGLRFIHAPNDGIAVRGAEAADNLIEECHIGFFNGASDGNGRHGIRLSEGAHGNTIRGCVILGNGGSGIVLEDEGTNGNHILGNGIGYSPDVDSGNHEEGLTISGGASENIVGGPGTEANVIASNRNGILITDAATRGNIVRGNFVGTNEDGDGGLGNLLDGIALRFDTRDNVIGGSRAGNAIAGNGRHGLSLLYGATGTAVAGNQIGIAGRNVPLGNAQNGILIFDAKTNLVGGTEEGAANIIAHNGEEGVVVNGVDATENTLRQNSIYANARGGIVLRDNANAGILPPRVVNLSPIAGHATPDAIVEFFADEAGQGESFLGSATTNGDGAFSAPLELASYAGQQLTTTVTDAAGNTSAFSEPRPIVDGGGEGEGEGEGECADPCEAVADSDGDGLTDCLEVCEYQTDPEQSDSDGDGMPDNYEREFETGLDPLAGEDGGLDADGDTLSNFEEFLRRTSPLDAADPDIVIFVAPPPLGADAPGRGTLPQPYATIAFALTQISPTAEIPARIVLLGGGYAEDAVLAPFVTLVGFPGADAVVEGTLIVSPPAQVLDLTLQAGAAAQTLLTVAGGDGAVLLAGLLFSGAGQSGVTGVMLEEGAGGVELESCRFDALALGLRAEGPVPRLRRCAFSNVNTGVQIAASDAAMAKSLGDAADPATGWNDFDLASIAGPAVVNERPEELKAELNNWTTDDAEEIGAKLEGAVDFEPFLVTEQEASILAASLYCTVWDSSTQTPIENATVELTPSGYPPVTENTEGLYTFPVLAAGAYDVEVNALGFAGGAAAVELADGELKSIVVPLGVPGAEGEGEGEDPPMCCRRFEGDGGPFWAEGALLVITLLVASRFPHPRRR